MFQYATHHSKRKALLTIKNAQDLTPLNLSAKLGRKELFSQILEFRNIVRKNNFEQFEIFII